MAPVIITQDYYAVLEVDVTATTEVIVKSYKRLALKHHPDRNAGQNTTEKFQLVSKVSF
jgi:DnaJ-class molecular chaperone